ncbi:MAG: nitroreductase [Firmicutes bacterium]|nr:nitroreductase [Bacillota bacterium]
MNDVLKTIDKRVSLRKYKDTQITDEHKERIIKSAMRAPTAGNMMLYSIITVEDDKKKEKLSKSCDNQPFIKNAPLVLIFLADMQRWYDYYKSCDVEKYCEDNDLEFRGPEVSDLLLASNDAIIAAQNAVIAAESLNIGSCYIGDIMENYEIHKEMLNLPDLVFPISMLCLGYYPEDSKRIIKPRFNKKYIVYNEEYKRLTNDEFKDMFSHLEKVIPDKNKFNAKNPGQFIYARKTGAEFSKEMVRSVNKALEKWDGKKL